MLNAADIAAALAADDVPRAAALAEAALARGARAPLLLHLAAWARETAGDLPAAQLLIEEALQLAPGDAPLHAAAARLARLSGKLSVALRATDAALACDAGCIAAWLERGAAFEAGGSLAAAAESYQRAAALAPDAAAAHAGLAAVAARLGDWPAARDHARTALAHNPDDSIALSALARADLESGAADAALAALQAGLARDVFAGADATVALTVLGEAHDRLGNSAAAVAAFARAKAAFAAMHAHHFGGDLNATPHSDLMAGIQAGLDRHHNAAWAPPPLPEIADAMPRHIFLLGFPRSGTTLVETILAAGEGVATLEERPTLAEADRAFLADAGGLDRLLAHDTAGLADYARAYWQRVRAAGVSASATALIDMDPLKGLRLPLIARLFPAARVVLLRRDPRDVVWSCFRTNFALTAAAYEFTTLERTARHYAALMTLTQTAITTLPLNLHMLRYEDLVRDFDTTTQALSAFTGIAWTPAMRRFDRTATAQAAATASAGQVRRPLFDGSGQWRRHADALEPVLPILAPWVEAFGYAD